MRISRANSTFWVFWLCALLWCYINSFDDPSSIFFSRARAFYRSYSAAREAEVHDFLDKILSKPPVSTTEQENELLCVGIPSVNRTSSTYLLNTMGSLMDTLTKEERDSVYFVVLLADKNPRQHFAYGQRWLSWLADDVVVYDSKEDRGTTPQREEPEDAYRVIPYDIRRKGRGRTRAETTHIDHSVLIETCRLRGSPYFALVQDDIIASRDWFSRLKAGIAEVEQRTEQSGQDWLYLRLFYSELLMGWNSEEVPGYLRMIAIAYFILASACFVAWRLRRRSGWHSKLPLGPPTAQSFNHTVALLLGLWTPATIVLAFMAGRITLHRMVHFSPQHVFEMPRYGCCAQGLVFPHRHLEGLQTMLREPPYRFPVDMVMDTYGADDGLGKWALEPSVLQHVGRTDSSDRGKEIQVWNFSFERQY